MMNEQNHEQRIAALEMLLTEMAESTKKAVANEASFVKTILETKALNMLTLRLILAAGLIKDEAIRQPLEDMIARGESKDDQITAHVMEIQARLGWPSPSVPPTSN